MSIAISAIAHDLIGLRSNGFFFLHAVLSFYIYESFPSLSNKLDIHSIYALAQGVVLEVLD